MNNITIDKMNIEWLIYLHNKSTKILIQMRYEMVNRSNKNIGILIDKDESALNYQKLDKEYLEIEKEIKEIERRIKLKE